MLDDLRKAIAEYEARLAKGRRTPRKYHHEIMQTQALLVITLNSLKHTLHQIEKSHQMVATSHALLEEVAQIERRRADQASHYKKPPTLHSGSVSVAKLVQKTP